MTKDIVDPLIAAEVAREDRAAELWKRTHAENAETSKPSREVRPRIADGWQLIADGRAGKLGNLDRRTYSVVLAANELLTYLARDHADEVLAKIIDGDAGQVRPARLHKVRPYLPRPGRSGFEQPRQRLGHASSESA